MKELRIKSKVLYYIDTVNCKTTINKKCFFRANTCFFGLALSLLCLLLFPAALASLADASSLAGSYTTRARGTAASYWNPANLLYPTEHSSELLLGSTYFNIGNNALSIRRYNNMNGSFLDERDKNRLLSSIDDRLTLRADFSHGAGYSFNRFALTARINMHTQGKLSSDYLELLLYGNEFGREYHFPEEDNGFGLLLYSDLTYGQGIYKLEVIGRPLYTGVSLSLLNGHFFIDTDEYSSEFSASEAGLYFDQLITVKTATKGSGLKSMIGLSSEVTKQITAALVIDNFFGFIRWSGDNEKTSYTANVNNVYMSDLGSDIVITSDSTTTLSGFTSYIYPSIITAVEYESNDFLISLDWKQGFTDSVLSSKTAEIGMGIEYRKLGFLPLRMGYKPGFNSRPHRFTYGAGLDTKDVSFSVALESCNALFPSNNSQGIALSASTRLKFR